MYEQIGGQKVIDQLVEDFYSIMRSHPEAEAVLATHAGRDMLGSREKLRSFLSGWLGGPQLYLEKFGHPRLRMRHFPFKIGEKEAAQWMFCMKEALKKSPIDLASQEKLLSALGDVALMLKNQLE